MALARKAPSLLALSPDIAVVQECAKESVFTLSTLGFSGVWFGANPNKGLAVFCSKEFTVQAVGKPFGKWVVPVRIHGEVVDFSLLAVWACPVGTKRADNYIGEVHPHAFKTDAATTICIPRIFSSFNRSSKRQADPSLKSCK